MYTAMMVLNRSDACNPDIAGHHSKFRFGDAGSGAVEVMGRWWCFHWSPQIHTRAHAKGQRCVVLS